MTHAMSQHTLTLLDDVLVHSDFVGPAVDVPADFTVDAWSIECLGSGGAVARCVHLELQSGPGMWVEGPGREGVVVGFSYERIDLPAVRALRGRTQGYGPARLIVRVHGRRGGEDAAPEA